MFFSSFFYFIIGSLCLYLSSTNALDHEIFNSKLEDFYSQIFTSYIPLTMITKDTENQNLKEFINTLKEICHHFLFKIQPELANTYGGNVRVPVLPESIKKNLSKYLHQKDFENLLTDSFKVRNMINFYFNKQKKKDHFNAIQRVYVAAYGEKKTPKPANKDYHSNMNMNTDNFYDSSNAIAEKLTSALRAYYGALDVFCPQISALPKPDYYYGNTKIILGVLHETCDFYKKSIQPYRNNIYPGMYLPRMKYELKLQSREVFSHYDFNSILTNTLNQAALSTSEKEAYKVLIRELAQTYRQIQ